MQEHGSFDMKIIDQTLIVKCFDAWNLETVLRMCEEYKILAKKIADKPWGCLVDLSQWELSTPDIWDEIAKLNTWGNKHNQKFEVVIYCMSLQKTLLADSHQVLTNVETHFCDNIEQAYTWLTQVGVLNNVKES